MMTTANTDDDKNPSTFFRLAPDGTNVMVYARAWRITPANGKDAGDVSDKEQARITQMLGVGVSLHTEAHHGASWTAQDVDNATAPLLILDIMDGLENTFDQIKIHFSRNPTAANINMLSARFAQSTEKVGRLTQKGATRAKPPAPAFRVKQVHDLSYPFAINLDSQIVSGLILAYKREVKGIFIPQCTSEKLPQHPRATSQYRNLPRAAPSPSVRLELNLGLM